MQKSSRQQMQNGTNQLMKFVLQPSMMAATQGTGGGICQCPWDLCHTPDQRYHLLHSNNSLYTSRYSWSKRFFADQNLC